MKKWLLILLLVFCNNSVAMEEFELTVLLEQYRDERTKEDLRIPKNSTSRSQFRFVISTGGCNTLLYLTRKWVLQHGSYLRQFWTRGFHMGKCQHKKY